MHFCVVSVFRLFLFGTLLFGVAACTRPLTENERAFAKAYLGEEIDTDEVRVARGLGLAPVPRPPRAVTVRKVEVPAGVCDRDAPREPSPGGGRAPPAAVALQNQLHFSRTFYASDTLHGWPEMIRLPYAFVMLHELVHVWQWQNRDQTDFATGKAALESVRAFDPYFYELGSGLTFKDFGFEQQAAMVEDYLCYATFDPANPKRAELASVLYPVFPMGR